MDIRTPAVLACGILALIIAAATLLFGTARRVQLVFFAFASSLGSWYLLQAHSEVLLARRSAALPMAALPALALWLFDELVPREASRWSTARKRTFAVVLPIAATMALASARWPDEPWVRITSFVYVFAALSGELVVLSLRARRSTSRVVRARILLLVILGGLATIAAAVDFGGSLQGRHQGLVRLISAALAMVLLFALAESIRRERLLDPAELLARLLVAAVLAAVIALSSYGAYRLSGQLERTALVDGLIACGVIFFFEPLRRRVEALFQRLFVRVSFDLHLWDRLAHVLDVDDMGTIIMDALARSRRVTAAGLYLRDPDGAFFDRVASLGSSAPRRIEAAIANVLLARLEYEPLSLEQLDRDVRELRAQSRHDEIAPAMEAVLAVSTVLGDLRRGVVVGVHDEQRSLIGILAVSDERSNDVFSPDDIAVLAEIAGHVRMVVEGSRVYEQMKARDRLTVVGQMAVGLAHEIKNPLGAIKGAAQALARPVPVAPEVSSRLLQIITSEVDRLDGVVTRVLDLTPGRSTTGPVDVNAVILRTLQVLSSEPGNDTLEILEQLDPALPRVDIDQDQLGQVLMNLLRNAAQVLSGGGEITVASRLRLGVSSRSTGVGTNDQLVEVTIADNGPGVSRKVLNRLFTPFFTTKARGVGLGLAISQSIIQTAGGRIEVHSHVGEGTTFAVILPVSELATPAPTPANRVLAGAS
jgi:two-component system, NtrC family, sensor histidine kinase HydH